MGTLGWALVQSSSIAFYLKQVLFDWTPFLAFEIILWLTTGAMIVLWLSELVTEYGLGNGASLLIYINIISSLPNLGKKLVSENIGNLTVVPCFGIVLLFFIAVSGIITLQESARIIPLISSKQLGQSKSFISKVKPNNYIPLRFNQAGVMPIILTTAILVLPNYITSLGVFPVLTIPIFLKSSKIFYWVSYFILILFFSSFYSTIVLNPKNIVQGILNISSFNGLGTTSLLILVGVVLDLSREMKSIMLSNIYNERFD